MSGSLLKNEPLAKYTSWRVGGPADQMYLPENKQDLIDFLATLPKHENIFWLGLGSNLLVRDGGVKGTVINTRGRLKVMQLIDSTKVYVEAGVACPHVARFCTDLGLSGAEFLAGIPGTIGGALKMNAGAFGGETWNIVDRLEMVNSNGHVTNRGTDQFEVAYRTVKGIKNEWFLSVILTLKKGETQISQQKIKTLLEQRSLTQPTNKPTCGSVFKNPPGDYAARLIESCNLKGYALGGACVSKKHANFIENTGQATAADIEKLIEHIQQQVKQLHDINLHTEVCRVGESL
ncbi:MAG: UDP-N-acetylmuramate dehydrogenase [Methylococcales bacterium]|nr:UDP-N-acetylmuramate dehydrogenase [Methylococcales bacterium]